MLYERDLIAKWNEYANYTTAREDGLLQGQEEGRELGRELGWKQGQEEAQTAVVKNLLFQTDFAADKIAAIANVTEDFVEKVKKTLN